MKTLAWATDVHLDFLDGPNDVGRVDDEFATPLSKVSASGVLLTGDISTAQDIVRHLSIIDRRVNKPVYFVLGNHDYYGGDVRSVRHAVQEICSRSKNLKYLTTCRVVSLSKKTALVGHDGWYDAYHGDAGNSPYVMSDWFKIADFYNAGAMSGVGWSGRAPNRAVVMGVARKLAFEAAEHVEANAALAARDHEVVVIATHVPPFPEAHLHEGKGGSSFAMPWYTSRLMGDSLLKVAKENPNTRFEVFCGHTHGACDVQISENLFCHVGGSEYNHPRVSGTIRLP